MQKKQWIRFPQEKMLINQVNNRIVVDEDAFMVWELGKTKTFADILKKNGGYKIRIGKRYGGKTYHENFHKDRGDALKELIKEMKKSGRIKF